MPAFEGDPKSYSVDDLNENGMTGYCLCRPIKVITTQKTLFAKPDGHICHCLKCRRVTGSNAWSTILLSTKDVVIEDPKGYLKNYMDGDTSTGSSIPRSFCSNCGSTLDNISKTDDQPSHVAVALGLFPRMPTPEFELSSAHRQEWMKPAVPEDKQHEYRPAMTDKY